jgi:hypothetical protein
MGRIVGTRIDDSQLLLAYDIGIGAFEGKRTRIVGDDTYDA